MRNPYRPWLESWLAAEDPWHYRDGADADRHGQALALLPARTGDTLEVGCSEGQFTVLVAPRASRVVAVELVSSAARRAAIRTAELEHVDVRVADATRRLPMQQFDTVVCMDVLYYVPVSLLPIVRRRITRRVRPGGHLLLQHELDEIVVGWDAETGGAECQHPPFLSLGFDVVESMRGGGVETVLLRRRDVPRTRDVLDDLRDVVREPWLASGPESGTGRAEVELTTGELVVDNGKGWRRRVLLRVNDRPVGDAFARPPFDAASIREVAAQQGTALEALLAEAPAPARTVRAASSSAAPADISVAICTTGGAAGVDALLAELRTAFTCHVEENGSPMPRLADTAATTGATYRHHREGGLAAARNRAMDAATTEWVLFLDDDVVVRPGDGARLAAALAHAVSDAPDVGAVTGLVLPASLDDASAVRFERYASHRRGDRRVRHDASSSAERRWPVLGADACGVGACMAVRTAAWRAVGGFDERLGAGTPARSAEDDAYFRALIERGWAVVYDPSIAVRHRHRADDSALRTQLHGYAVGASAQLVLLGLDRRDRSLARVWLRVLAMRVGRRRDLPRDLWATELLGHLRGAVIGGVTGVRTRRS